MTESNDNSRLFRPRVHFVSRKGGGLARAMSAYSLKTCGFCEGKPPLESGGGCGARGEAHVRLPAYL